MKEFIKLKYETPELKVILVDKDIVTASLGVDFGGTEYEGPEAPIE